MFVQHLYVLLISPKHSCWKLQLITFVSFNQFFQNFDSWSHSIVGVVVFVQSCIIDNEFYFIFICCGIFCWRWSVGCSIRLSADGICCCFEIHLKNYLFFGGHCLLKYHILTVCYSILLNNTQLEFEFDSVKSSWIESFGK